MAVAVFAGIGLVVIRRLPRNAIGWLLLSAAALLGLNGLSTGYIVLDYRVHGGGLPLGRAAFAVEPAWVPAMVCVGLAVLLFPAGAVPSPRWRRPLLVYCAFGAWFSLAVMLAGATARLGPHVRIDAGGNYTGNGGPFSDHAAAAAWVTAPVTVGFWVAFIAAQARAWRRAEGERREQLKWLMCGGALSVVSIVVLVFTNGAEPVVSDVSALGVAALPIGIGVGILRYRLYEIDRLISRTISYAVVTGSLVALFVGLVVLTTDVLPFSSPVGVAASTLAAAALFNPLRRRVQHLVDRRFNRGRYDAEATVEAFARRLRDAVDPETVQATLADAVRSAVEPSLVAVWLRSEA